MSKKYHLSLDTGISNIGWSLVEINKSNNLESNKFVQAGQVVFDLPSDSSSTNASLRRRKFSQKRMISRKRRRIFEVIKFFEPITKINYSNWKSSSNLLERDVIKLKTDILAGKNQNISDLNFLQCMVHYAKNRGPGVWDKKEDEEENIFLNEKINKKWTDFKLKKPFKKFTNLNKEKHKLILIDLQEDLKKFWEKDDKENVFSTLEKIDAKIENFLAELSNFDKKYPLEDVKNNLSLRNKRKTILENINKQIYKEVKNKENKISIKIDKKKFYAFSDYNKEYYKKLKFPSIKISASPSYYENVFVKHSKFNQENPEPMLFDQDEWKSETIEFIKNYFQNKKDFWKNLRKKNTSNQNLSFISENEAINYLIEEIIFKIIPFEDGFVKTYKKGESNLRFQDWYNKNKGFCTYKPNSQRLEKSSLYADLYRIANEISKAILFEDTEEFKEKFKNFILNIFNFYLKTFNLSKTLFKEELKNFDIKRNKTGFEEMDLSINLFLKNLANSSESLKKDLEKINFEISLKENKLSILNLDNEIFNSTQELLKQITPKIREKKFENLPSFNKYWNKDFKAFNKSSFKLILTSTINVSEEFVQECLFFMINDSKSIYKYLSEQNISKDIFIVKKSKEHELFAPFTDRDLIKNPVASRVLSIFRKLLKGIFNEYEKNGNKIISIGLETARDVFKTAKEKEQQTLENKKRKEEKHNFYKQLISSNDKKTSSKDDLKITLTKDRWKRVEAWYKQGGYKKDSIDIYIMEDDGSFPKKINKNNFNEFTLDHIYPRTWKTINSTKNLILTSVNWDKSSLSPIMYFERIGWTSKKINLWKTKMQDLFEDEPETLTFLLNKSKNIQLESLYNDQISSYYSLSSRYMVNYLNFELNHRMKHRLNNNEKIEIFELNGKLVSSLRKNWLDSKGWGFKDKEIIKKITPYDNMVDAMVGSNITEKTMLLIYNKLIKMFFYEFPRILKNHKNLHSLNEIKLELIETVESFMMKDEETSKLLSLIKLNWILKNIIEETKNTKKIDLNFINELSKKYLKPSIFNFSEKTDKFVPVNFKLNKNYLETINSEKTNTLSKEKEDQKDKFNNILESINFVSLDENSLNEWKKKNDENNYFPHIWYRLSRNFNDQFTSKEFQLSKIEKLDKQKFKKNESPQIIYEKDQIFFDIKKPFDLFISKDKKIWESSYVGLLINKKPQDKNFQAWIKFPKWFFRPENFLERNEKNKSHYWKTNKDVLLKNDKHKLSYEEYKKEIIKNYGDYILFSKNDAFVFLDENKNKYINRWTSLSGINSYIYPNFLTQNNSDLLKIILKKLKMRGVKVNNNTLVENVKSINFKKTFISIIGKI